MSERFEWNSESRKDWGSANRPEGEMFYQALQIGCLQRIADSLEALVRMAGREERRREDQRIDAARQRVFPAFAMLDHLLESCSDSKHRKAIRRVRRGLSVAVARAVNRGEVMGLDQFADLGHADIEKFPGVGATTAALFKEAAETLNGHLMKEVQ